MKKHAFFAFAALALSAAPALAQHEQHAPPAPKAKTEASKPKTEAPKAKADEHAGMDMSQMVCTMGMLPHGQMGGGMMGGAAMGGMMPSMKQGQAAAGAKAPGAMGGMQHGAMGGMHGQQPKAAAAPQAKADAAAPAAHDMGMSHPVTPTMLIHHAQDIALTPEQTAKVTELLTSSKSSCDAHLKMGMEAHHAATALLGGPTATPDVAAYEGKLREAFTHVLQGHVAVVKAGVEAKKLLTPAQLEKLGKHEM